MAISSKQKPPTTAKATPSKASKHMTAPKMGLMDAKKHSTAYATKKTQC